ncbi:MAG: ferritin family protein [Betaproteobacteria bacterium]
MNADQQSLPPQGASSLPETPPGAAPSVAAVAPTLEAFMAQALAMEFEAVERYSTFADAMETHNNLEVAAMFRTMAGYETKHAEQIMKDMGWTTAPAASTAPVAWTGFDAPETAPIDAVHYLMQPWHALQLALAAEQRAEAFFGALAAAATSDSVRKAALQLQAEEAEHVALVRAWMAKVPQPDSDWAVDPDPPRYTE